MNITVTRVVSVTNDDEGREWADMMCEAYRLVGVPYRKTFTTTTITISTKDFYTKEGRE